jgi:hypothetical protein
VIVWLASFPRSGNTFLRIVVHRLYGVRTSTVYDVDGVAQRLGAGLVGFEEREATFEDMRASDQVHFVKTHRPRDEDVDAVDGPSAWSGTGGTRSSPGRASAARETPEATRTSCAR